MNWVGGVRSRLKTKDEKKRQKEFFEKMRYSNKVRRVQRTTHPMEAPPPPASLDLLSLEAADFSATKFRKSDTGKSLRHKVKKVELDGGKGLFPSEHHRHHHHDLELPMSPCAPSKLHLQEPEREPMPSTSSCFTLSATETMEPPLHWTIPEEPSEFSQSSYYHSTPVPEVVPPIAQQLISQHPLKHQGKSSEDIFFSFVPRCQDMSQPKEEEHDTSQYTVCDEETLSDEFDYSPLSTIPSQSSIASSTVTLILYPATQDTVSSSPAKTAFQWEETHSQRQINRSSSKKNMIDLTEDVPFPCKMMTKPKWAENLPKDPRQMTLSPFIRKLQANKGADKHSDVLMKEEKPTPHQTDLMCKEDDYEFLSPLCQNVKPAKPATGQFYTKCQDSKSTLQPPDDERNENLSRSATTYKVEVKGHPMENDPIKEECSYPEKGRDLMQVEDAHIAKDESVEKQTPTMSISKVCQQVLREVLQLDSELQTNNNTVLQPTPDTEEFSNFATTQKRNEVEQFPTGTSDAKSKVHALEATTDCAKKTISPEQFMPNESLGATPLVPKTPTDVQHHRSQNKKEDNKEEDNKENESHKEFQQTNFNELIKEEQKEQLEDSVSEDMHDLQGNHPAAKGQVERFNSTVDSNLPDEQTAGSICPRPDSTSLEFTSHSRGTLQKDQTTQCLIISAEPGQNKETQCSVDEFLPAASSSECSHDWRVKPIQSLRSDAYDECILS